MKKILHYNDRKKYIIGVIGFIVLYGIILYFAINSKIPFVERICKYPNMEIEFSSTNHKESLVIFYDSGKEPVFDDKHIAVNEIYPTNSFQKIIARIPLNGFSNIRIDLGNNPGKTKIKSITIRKNLFEKKILAQNDILEYFSGVNLITRYEVDNNVVIEYEGNDPFIRSNTLNQIKYDKSIMGGIFIIIKFIFISLIINSGLYISIVYMLRKIVILKKKTAFLLNNGKSKIKTVLLMLCILVFISVPIYFTVDSAWYLSYLKFFEGHESFNEWELIRGWIFPALLYITSKIFGLTAQGMLCLMLLCYLLTIYMCNKFIKIIDDGSYRYYKYLLILIIAFNPIIFGYYHTLLTEFAGATLCLFNILFYLWIYKQEEQKKKSSIVIKTIVLSINLILAYSLKQTYVAFIILPYLGIEFLRLIKTKKIYNIANICVTLIIGMSILLLSNKLWINYIEAGNIFYNAEKETDDKGSAETAFSYSLINGATYFEIVDEETVAVLNDEMEVESTFSYSFNNQSNFEYIFECFMNAPDKLIKGYIDNYLVLTNFYGRGEDRKSAIKEASFTRGNENSTIASAFGWYSRGKHFYEDQQYDELKEVFSYDDLTQFKFPVDSSKIISILYKTKIISKMSKMLFTFCFLIAPFLFIFLLIYILVKIIKKKHIDFIIEACFVLETTVFGFVSALAILNNQIDRYCFPVYILAILGTFIFIYEVGKRGKKAINQFYENWRLKNGTK